ncbi:class D sortase [Virgibacillus oceani]
MKQLSIIFVLVGLLFLGYGGYQLFKTEAAQKDSLAEAQAFIEREKSTQETDQGQQDFYPEKGDAAGILHIPKLEAELPIIEGTHEDELEKGVGHYEGTAYPQQNDQIVLSGHRDTVFRDMGELEMGDILTVEVPYGSFSYEIIDTKIVDADDRTIIVPTAPDEVLTLSTCYPFNYVGSAPDRYIITALPVEEN